MCFQISQTVWFGKFWFQQFQFKGFAVWFSLIWFNFKFFKWLEFKTPKLDGTELFPIAILMLIPLLPVLGLFKFKIIKFLYFSNIYDYTSSYHSPCFRCNKFLRSTMPEKIASIGTLTFYFNSRQTKSCVTTNLV